MLAQADGGSELKGLGKEKSLTKFSEGKVASFLFFFEVNHGKMEISSMYLSEHINTDASVLLIATTIY